MPDPAQKPDVKPSVRLDRWLWATRCFKTRTQAQEACSGGHLKVNGQTAKPSHALRIGDEVQGTVPRGKIIWRVLGLGEKRTSPELARQLYEDNSPPPPPKEPIFVERDRGAGRPTKSDRRAMRRLRGER